MTTQPVDVEPAVESARRQKTRDRLMDAAFDVFAEQGVHAASIEAVTERAGFTRGAFYSNFASKEELFFALAERENGVRLDRLQEGIDIIFPTLATPVESLDIEAVAEIVDRFMLLQPNDRHWCIVESEFRTLALRSPEVAARYIDYETRIDTRLARLLEDAVGTVGLRFTIDSLQATRIITTLAQQATYDAILAGPDVATDDLARANARRVLPAVLLGLTEPVA